MGYACPVCGDPQADGEHLANHLAFTAMRGDDDHEAWLDANAPEWAASSPTELAQRVVERAEEREYPQVFEDTTESGGRGEGRDGRGHGGGHDHGDGHGHDGADPESDDAVGHARGREGDPIGGPVDYDAAALDDADRAETRDVLAEARELTRRRRANAGDDTGGSDEADDTDDGGDAAEDGESGGESRGETGGA